MNVMPCKCKCIRCCAVVSTMRAGKCYTTPGQSVTGRITASSRLTPLISLANPLSLPPNFSLSLQVAAAGTKEEGFFRMRRINQNRSSWIGTALRRRT